MSLLPPATTVGSTKKPLAVGPSPAGDDLGALGAAALEVSEHAFELALVDQRPHRRALVERVAEHDLAGGLRETGHDVVVAVAVDEDPRARSADLALVREEPHRDPRDDGLEVGVGEDDLRRLPAELERHATELPGGLDRDLPADLRAAREADLADVRVPGERRAGRLAEPRDDVDRTFGEAGLGD
jgi:hypothetical protein